MDSCKTFSDYLYLYFNTSFNSNWYTFHNFNMLCIYTIDIQLYCYAFDAIIYHSLNDIIKEALKSQLNKVKVIDRKAENHSRCWCH
jgi:hypothetical protein